MIVHTSNEIAQDKESLFNEDMYNFFDIGYSHDSKSIFKEEEPLLISKSKNKT